MQVSIMETRKYAVTLKSILHFSNIKYSAVADAVGYDISYISKWLTGARLPASRNIDDINYKISKYATDVLFKQKQVEAFSKEFMVVLSETKEALAQEIYGLLSEAYRMSIRKEIDGEKKENKPQIIIGKTACQQVLKRSIKHELENSIVSPSIIITGEFFDLEHNCFFDMLAQVFLSEYSCNIHIGLNFDTMRKDSCVYTGRLYHWLDTLLDFQFSIYQNTTEDTYKNIIVIENSLAILYYLDEQKRIDMCVVIRSINEINHIYNQCKEYMLTLPVLLMPKKTLGMQRFGYRDMFFSSDKYFYFLAHGFEFLLPDAVFDSLMKHVRNGEYRPIDERWIRRIQLIWKNLMDKAELHFLLPSNSIIQYLETGYIHLNDFSYKLSLEERKLHIEQVFQVMKDNPRITMGVLLPETGQYSYGKFSNLSFYSNYATAFFKKDLQKIHKQTAPVYLVNSLELLQYFHVFFESQKQSEGYREYTYEELIELYRRYEFLLQNIFSEA